MVDNFSIDFFSDSRDEKLITGISYKRQIIRQLNNDKGNDLVEIQFFSENRVLLQLDDKPILL